MDLFFIFGSSQEEGCHVTQILAIVASGKAVYCALPEGDIYVGTVGMLLLKLCSAEA